MELLSLNWKGLALTREEAMAPHSSTLAWKIPWIEEPGGLQSMGLKRVGHDYIFEIKSVDPKGNQP